MNMMKFMKKLENNVLVIDANFLENNLQLIENNEFNVALCHSSVAVQVARIEEITDQLQAKSGKRIYSSIADTSVVPKVNASKSSRSKVDQDGDYKNDVFADEMEKQCLYAISKYLSAGNTCSRGYNSKTSARKRTGLLVMNRKFQSKLSSSQRHHSANGAFLDSVLRVTYDDNWDDNAALFKPFVDAYSDGKSLKEI